MWPFYDPIKEALELVEGEKDKLEFEKSFRHYYNSIQNVNDIGYIIHLLRQAQVFFYNPEFYKNPSKFGTQLGIFVGLIDSNPINFLAEPDYIVSIYNAFCSNKDKRNTYSKYMRKLMAHWIRLVRKRQKNLIDTQLSNFNYIVKRLK